MPTYITLLNFTDQGIRTVRETLHRAERAADFAQKHGARLEQLYWTVGPPYFLGRGKAPKSLRLIPGTRVDALGQV
jgi:uncharacterized protein with GYD domain